MGRISACSRVSTRHYSLFSLPVAETCVSTYMFMNLNTRGYSLSVLFFIVKEQRRHIVSSVTKKRQISLLA